MSMQNFRVFEAGRWAELQQHLFEAGPLRKAGKVFLSEALQCTGMEISLNRIEPGEGYEFLRRHEIHEEVYLIISGTGEFQVDGEQFPVCEGSAVRISPQGVRTVRATGDEPLCYACIQAVVGSLTRRTITDGRLVDGAVHWN
jgi:mannose-6-phosphate isomerase-like protein (cupin superfamily)